MNEYIEYHKQPYVNPISIQKYNITFGKTLLEHPLLEDQIHAAYVNGRKLQPDMTEHLNNTFPEHINCTICNPPKKIIDNIDLETALLVESVSKDYISDLFVFGSMLLIIKTIVMNHFEFCDQSLLLPRQTSNVTS